MEYASKINKEDIIYLDDSVIHLSIHDAVLHSLHKRKLKGAKTVQIF
jgi:hypothetical protein